MAGTLLRILRLRYLAEEQARLELMRQTQRLRQAQFARTGISRQVQQQRERLAGSFLPAADPQGGANVWKEIPEEQEWLLAEAALEFSSWNQMQLEQWCIREAARVAPFIETYQRSRRELRQMEQLVENERKAEQLLEDRREQAEADSWFQIATQRRIRTKKKGDPLPS